MYIETDGKVGIGTTSPDTLLHISGANNVNLLKLDAPKGDFVFKTNSTSGYTSNFRLDDTGMDIGHDSIHRALNLQTGDADRLTILGGGNVGIGTTNPTAKLTIDGDVAISASGDIDIANEKRIRFAASDGTYSDDTSLRRAGGEAIRFRYNSNAFIFDATDNQNW